MKDTEVIEMLCQAQDLNKYVRTQAVTDNQIAETDRFESNIQKQFKSLYVN